MSKVKKVKEAKVKNTTKKAVLLSVEPGVALRPGEVMFLDGKLLKDALKVKGVVKTEEEVGHKVPKTPKEPSKKGK